jgi:hypothetical protein
MALTHAVPTGRVSFSACVGGEVRGTIVVNATLQADDTVTWAPFLELEEGSSCDTIDQDGYVFGRTRTLRPNYYMDGLWIRTSNKEENVPNDYVRVDYEVHHDAS